MVKQLMFLEYLVLKVGNAEKERQSADQRVADRKSKSGFIGPVFQVAVGHLSLSVLESYMLLKPGVNSKDQTEQDYSKRRKAFIIKAQRENWPRRASIQEETL